MSEQHQIEILLVEDSPTEATMVDIWLSEGLATPYSLHLATTLAEGFELLAKNDVDLIVLDLNLPDSSGLDTFRKMYAKAGGTPIVIMSGVSDEELAITAVREGAQEYVVKGTLEDNVLVRPARYAIERAARQRAEEELRRTQREILLARTVQKQLSPDKPPSIPGFEIAGRCEAARTAAGDYFDFFPMADDKWGIVIGDVSGHDLSSSLFMVGARAVMRTLITSFSDAGEILRRANNILQPDMRDGRFLTLMLLSLDPETRTFQFAAAGHPGYLLDDQCHVKQLLESNDQPLGIERDVQYSSSGNISIAPGETVFLFTDGITETRAPDGEFYGEPRLFELIKANRERSATELVDTVFAAADAFQDELAPRDDLTVVVLRAIE
jgi:sigma-B regulation protein RsbU (phosphoserine phosphatase)